MFYNGLRLSTIIVAVTFASVAWPMSAIAQERVPEEIQRVDDPRFDIERYIRSYTLTKGVLEKFQNAGCIGPENDADRQKWTDYALSLAKLLHDFAGRLNYTEVDADPVMSQRKESLDMADQLIAMAERARKLPPCPSPQAAPAPGPVGAPPPPLKLPPSLLQLVPCATNEEMDVVRKLLEKIGTLKARIASLEADIQSAQDAFDKKDTENSTANFQLYRALQDAKARDETPIAKTKDDVKDLQDEVIAIFNAVKARGDCPPPGAVPPPAPPPPKDGPDPAKPAEKPGLLKSILGHVSIGIGVGVEGGGGHRDQAHRRSSPEADSPPPVKAQPPRD